MSLRSSLSQKVKERTDQKQKPTEYLWKTNPNCLDTVRISLQALMKMTQHVESGGDIEVMGMLLGSCSVNSFQINDCFILPVEGTETRVNAQDEAYEFLINYKELELKSCSQNSIVGWYHSHPGYGCWLSGIDVATQRLHQQHFDPFVAIVIDPKKTMENKSSVEIGAFRTFSQGQQVIVSGGSDSSSPGNLPIHSSGSAMSAEKMHDYGIHASEYYQLKIEYFYSETDEQFLLQNYPSFKLSESILLNTDTIQSENAPSMANFTLLLEGLNNANEIGMKDKVYYNNVIKNLVEQSEKIATSLKIGCIAQQTIHLASNLIDQTDEHHQNHHHQTDHQEQAKRNKMDL